MAARTLLAADFGVDREYIVRLQGADREIMRTTLGAAAATPIINDGPPAQKATHTVYRRDLARRRYFEKPAWSRHRGRRCAGR